MSSTAYKNARNSYHHARALVNLLRGFLQYRDWSKDLEDRIDAGEMTQEQIDEGNKLLTKKRDLLYKRKTDVLNQHVFPAMANLTVLVEVMHEESYIRGKFEDDLKALFLSKSSKRGKSSKCIFERFIAACCTLTSAIEVDRRTREKKKTLSPDFRLILLDIMQQTIYRKMYVIANLKFDSPTFRKDKLLAEMENATLWTGEFAHNVKMKEMTDEAYRKKYHKDLRRPPHF